MTMKRIAKRILRPAYDLARRLIKEAAATDHDSLSQQVQRSIVNQYQSFKMTGILPYTGIRDAGFRVYSQFEEDGIILYVLSMIGFKTRRVVEMCCGAANECMATNLILNHGFDGYLFDGNLENVRAANEFFRRKHDCLLYQPVVTHAWITRDNVNKLLKQSGCAGEVDLFSLDIDGNDYWIWDAIREINPRLLVLETQNIIPANSSLTIEYRPDFYCWDRPLAEQDYRSVSLLAMQRLCKRRGYRMIGAHRHGFNVFFLRDNEGTQFFPEVSIEDVHDNHWTRWGQANRWPLVKDMPWREVESEERTGVVPEHGTCAPGAKRLKR
jgi:hypothetical protein